MKGKIICYRPGDSVYSISITGTFCELNCGHCSGKYLSEMKAGTDPKSLIDAMLKAKDGGAKRVLISGGFNKEGRLPIAGLMDALREGKRRTGLSIEVHSGVVTEKELDALADVGIEALLVDIIGDQETITDYLGGTWNVEDYQRVLKTAKDRIPIVAPHILIGVSDGLIKGEFYAIDMVAEGRVDCLAMLTLMDQYVTPRLDEVEKVMAYAREKVKVTLNLGCMRERGNVRLALEKLAIDLGYDGIANPTNEAMDYARSKGVEPILAEDCCVFTPI
jgi:uncharacterized radical SAM superfamily protein